LANLHCRTVNLIEEEDDGLVTSLSKPIWSTELGDLLAGDSGIIEVRQTKQVTFSHLRGTTLDNRQTLLCGILIDDCGLTDTVTASDENWVASIGNVSYN
jgi:hypothetical protein